MTYKGVIDEVKILANHSLMPNFFKPSLKKIAETLEMDRPKELTLSEVETYANEHNYVLWTEEMSEKALALIKADRDRPKGEWRDWLGKGNEWECSRCKCSIESHGSIAYNFCPMCGADIRKEKAND